MRHPCSHCGEQHDTGAMRYSHFCAIGPGPSEEWLCRSCAAAQDTRQEMVEVVAQMSRLKLDDSYERKYSRLLKKYNRLAATLPEAVPK
ncbi:MAG: hypothetical protein GC208_10445 [Alphaproteobacteria bacterium]|nr:hypothetical protein [Alphaproteobacteria bacterium]